MGAANKRVSLPVALAFQFGRVTGSNQAIQQLIQKLPDLMFYMLDRIGVPLVAEMVNYPNGIGCKLVRTFTDDNTGESFQRDLIKELFGSYFVKAKVTPSSPYFYKGGKKTFTEDVEAIKSIVNVCQLFADKDKISFEDNVFSSGNLSGTFVCVGGPRANLLSQLAMGYVDKDGDPNKGLVRISGSSPFGYEYIMRSESPDALNPWDVREVDGTIHESKTLKMLNIDYLLVSVFPNSLGSDSRPNEDKIVIFGAANRPGSRAIELLFKDYEVLKQIRNYVVANKSAAWQALVKVLVDRSQKPEHTSLEYIGCRSLNNYGFENKLLNFKEFYDTVRAANVNNFIPYRGNGRPSEKIRETAISSGEEKMSRSTRWEPCLTSYPEKELRAVKFTEEDLKKAVHLIWEAPELKGLPNWSPDGETLFMPQEAVEILREKGLRPDVSEIMSAGDLPPEERAEMRERYGM